MHGYALVQHIKQRSNDLLQVEEGSLYPALHGLELAGLLESEWKLSEANRRARFYRLTKTGRRQLHTKAERWERVSVAMANALRAT